MEILSFEGSNGSSKRKRSSKFVAIATIAALGFMGSTFAASITLNGASGIQYGQGVTQAVACNSDIVVTPANEFANVSNGGSFKLKSIKFEDTGTVTTSATDGFGACKGKTIKVALYGASSSTPLTMNTGSTTTYCEVDIANPAWSTNVLASVNSSECTGISLTQLPKGFQLVWGTPSVAAADIYKITLESF